MYLIVVGASAEGQRFIEIALEQKHEVALIEKDEECARQVLKKNDIRAFVSDISDDDILSEVEVDRADAMIAATHDDAENLMAMVLAKEHKVKRCISLINLQSHISIFEKLGVEVVSDPTGIVARQLYQFIEPKTS